MCPCAVVDLTEHRAHRLNLTICRHQPLLFREPHRTKHGQADVTVNCHFPSLPQTQLCVQGRVCRLSSAFTSGYAERHLEQCLGCTTNSRMAQHMGAHPKPHLMFGEVPHRFECVLYGGVLDVGTAQRRKSRRKVGVWRKLRGVVPYGSK
uniref:Uncharacterized protein n=1 Tax=Knipowitschia caucasica TaxID=637954 RepID=A0AAV2L959_KNICA